MLRSTTEAETSLAISVREANGERFHGDSECCNSIARIHTLLSPADLERADHVIVENVADGGTNVSELRWGSTPAGTSPDDAFPGLGGEDNATHVLMQAGEPIYLSGCFGPGAFRLVIDGVGWDVATSPATALVTERPGGRRAVECETELVEGGTRHAAECELQLDTDCYDLRFATTGTVSDVFYKLQMTPP